MAGGIGGAAVGCAGMGVDVLCMLQWGGAALRWGTLHCGGVRSGGLTCSWGALWWGVQWRGTRWCVEGCAAQLL